MSAMEEENGALAGLCVGGSACMRTYLCCWDVVDVVDVVGRRCRYADARRAKEELVRQVCARACIGAPSREEAQLCGLLPRPGCACTR